LDRTFRARQPGHGSWDRTARKGKPEQDRPNWTSKTGQEDDDMQIRNVSIDCQDMTASIELLGQSCSKSVNEVFVMIL
jgi:hypothetical protein